MKVLVVLREPPLPEGGAPGRCAIGLLQGLRAHGLEVNAIAARHHRVAAGRPPAHLRVELVDVTARIPSVSDYGPAGSYSRAELQSNGGFQLQPHWRSYLTRLRYPRGELSGGEFGARVRELAADADVVHLEETGTAWCSLGVAAPALVRIHYLIQLDRFWNVPWRSAFPLAGVRAQ